MCSFGNIVCPVVYDVMFACADKLLTTGFPDIFRHLVRMYVRSYTEHRNAPVECEDKAFDYICSPFICHTRIRCKHLDRLEYSYTLVDLRLAVCKIKCIAHTLLIRIKENLSFLFKIRYELIKQSPELQTVYHNIYAVSFDDIPQSLLGILKRKLIFIFVFKLSAAERATYDKICTGICFPFAAALFTLHCISPPFVDFYLQIKLPLLQDPSPK